VEAILTFLSGISIVEMFGTEWFPFVTMTNDRPMIIFLHYCGTGPAENLATGFKAAVNELGKHGGTAS